MREDKDFKPEKLEDGRIVYTNLDEVCKTLPEFGPLWCYICNKEIEDFSMNSNVGWWRYEAEDNALWFKVFHDDCYYPTMKKNE